MWCTWLTPFKYPEYSSSIQRMLLQKCIWKLVAGNQAAPPKLELHPTCSSPRSALAPPMLNPPSNTCTPNLGGPKAAHPLDSGKSFMLPASNHHPPFLLCRALNLWPQLMEKMAKMLKTRREFWAQRQGCLLVVITEEEILDFGLETLNFWLWNITWCTWVFKYTYGAAYFGC